MAEQNRRRKAAETVSSEAAVEVASEPTPAPRPKMAKAQVTVETDMIFRRRLEQGDHGPAVREVQRLLAANGGWDGPQDGRYGTLLARAIRVFQGSKGLKVNGEVDVLTWKALSA
jgi:peptidoglycan hydrolase-like protein with peptidoglycan-binding domain